MSYEKLGHVKGMKSGKKFEVKWNPKSREVFVCVAGWVSCGKASSAGSAMIKAEAKVYDK